MTAPLRVLVSMAWLGLGACRNEPPSPLVPDTSERRTASADAALDDAARARDAATHEAAPALEECRVDADCIVSTERQCCSCCPCSEPRALSRRTNWRDQCGPVACAPCSRVPLDCPACIDAEKEGFKARCVEARCQLVEPPR